MNPVLQSEGFESAAYSLQRTLNNFTLPTHDLTMFLAGFTEQVSRLARVEGMKAANQDCLIRGETPIYREDDFRNV